MKRADRSWMLYALCRDLDPKIFFPTEAHGVNVAKAICDECPASSACLEYALATRQDHGIWGGASERERRSEHRRRYRPRLAP